jgi:hypothetical protein
MAEHFENVASYVMGDDDSELAKVKAERDYALHCLEREIFICHQTDAAFLRHVQGSNGCERTSKPCRERDRCGCYLEQQAYINDEGLPTANDVRGIMATPPLTSKEAT